MGEVLQWPKNEFGEGAWSWCMLKGEGKGDVDLHSKTSLIYRTDSPVPSLLSSGIPKHSK